MPRAAIVFEAGYEGYLLSTDRARLDPAVIFNPDERVLLGARHDYWPVAAGCTTLPVCIYAEDGTLAGVPASVSASSSSYLLCKS